MSSHFEDLGLGFSDQSGFAAFISAVTPGAPRDHGKKLDRRMWIDPSGAAYAFFEQDGTGICAKPTFRGHQTVTASVANTLDDPNGCPMCSVTILDAEDDGAMLYPLPVEWDDVHLSYPKKTDKAARFHVTAFAERHDVWSSQASYEAARREAPGFAVRSLIPSGTFAPEGGTRPIRAEIIMTGVVTRAERSTNTYSQLQFDHAVLETYGASFDVVTPPNEKPLKPGNVIQGTFWLVAHRP